MLVWRLFGQDVIEKYLQASFDKLKRGFERLDYILGGHP